MTTRPDWPLGPALKAARLKAGLAVRAAARRTNGAISSGRWYQLESGYQRMRGHDIEIGTTPATVIAAAKAVDWDVEEALTTAGFKADEYEFLPAPGPLTGVTDEDLIAEVLRRMRGNSHHALEAAKKSDAPETGNEGEEEGDGDRPRSPDKPKPAPPGTAADPIGDEIIASTNPEIDNRDHGT